MKHLLIRSFAILLGLSLWTQEAVAIREARPIAGDTRLRTMVYTPDDVFLYNGFLGYQASIEFAHDEEVENVSMGDSTSWQIVPEGKRMFLKPSEPSSPTNMTVLTNRRIYQFEMHVKEAESINDPDMVFAIRFIYPDDGMQASIQHFSSQTGPDLTVDSHKFNFHYKINGSSVVSPLMIFDDGEFTYFKFKNKNAEIPAFFSVDPDGNESLVNYRISGEYVIIERVTSQFTLRSGSEVVCVFNETMPLGKPKKPKSFFGFDMRQYNDAR